MLLEGRARPPLSVVHFSTADIEGGSARSAYRIHTTLREMGHISHMLVGHKLSGDAEVATTHGGGWRRHLDAQVAQIESQLGLQYCWLPSGRRVLNHRWVQSADVFQLYNIHGGYLSAGLLPSLSRIAPIVWRLSDMWPMTGHCAYAGSCERWRTGCGKCPDLATYPGVGRDMTGWLWRRKRDLYARSRIAVVAPSTWIAALANESPLFSGCRVHHIPNGLDLEVFRPIAKSVARLALGLQVEARICLFSAQVAFDNPRKGTHILEEALNRIGERSGLVLVVVGEGATRWMGRVPQPVVALGRLKDDRTIALANAAADIAISTAPTENLSNTITEALACGTPVAAVPAGGIEDGVRHRSTGLVASAANAEAFSMVLEEMLDKADLEAMSREAAAFAQKHFDRRLETKRLLSLYEDLGAGQPHASQQAAGPMSHSASSFGQS